jgi:hypothetical protein
MSDIAIRVQNLSKLYRIGAREHTRRNLRQTAKSLATAPFDYLRRMSRLPCAMATHSSTVCFQRKSAVGLVECANSLLSKNR